MSLLLGKIVGLAFLLASGLLMVILSCALFGSAWPLLSVACFLLAPLPNLVGRRLAERRNGTGIGSWAHAVGDASLDSGMDAPYFLTSCLVVSGLGLPMLLAHSHLLPVPSMALCLGGGALIYATILGYSSAFGTRDAEPF